MSRKIVPVIDIVRLEDKETKLRSFIRTVIEQSVTQGDQTAGAPAILLIARSVESPVAKAVASLVREGMIAAPVRTILALMPRATEDNSVSDTLTALVGRHGGRIVRDVRLFDAHEQLVLGPAASWVGDCMRRDPMKRDAYECFAADCSKNADWARKSFARMWESCDVLPDDALTITALAGADACALPPGVEDASPDPFRTPSR